MRKSLFILLLPFVLSITCCNNPRKAEPIKNIPEVIAFINDREILLSEIDSVISMQLFQLRMEALEITISKKILMCEAARRNVELDKLIEQEIHAKSRKVTNEDINDYYSQSGVSYIDSNYVKSYLTSINNKRRQIEFTDSLKQLYSLKRKLRPPYYRFIVGSNLYAHNLTENSSATEVYIISDFSCPSCQKAEIILQDLYTKYNSSVNFKFVFYGEYIDELAMACEAAHNQNKFREMHDLIFSNYELVNKDSISYSLARSIGLDIDKFEKDLKDNQILQKLMINKDTLVNNGIYSTPTFIVNGKILSENYAIEYLEDMIIEELAQNN